MRAAFSIVIFLFGFTLHGQTVDWNIIVRTQLLTDATDFSRPFDVGIHFQLEPEWYVYWINPGDGGLPIEVRWELPDGWSIGPIRYPLPQKFVHDDMVSYGYKNDVLLLATVVPARGARSDRLPAIVARLDWLVCKESCVRGKATVRLTHPSGSPKAIAELFQRTRNRLPRPLEQSGLIIQGAEIVGGTGMDRIVRFTVTGPMAERVSDFYPEPLEEASVHFNSITVKDGKVSFVITPNSNDARISSVRGVLVADDSGYECHIPLKPNP